jgi:hypothetical protein
MTDPRKTEDRDSVLFAFHQDCNRPTAEQIIAWIDRYPQFAEDIRAHAAVAWDWALRDRLPAEEVDQSLAKRAYSQTLNAIFDEENTEKNIQVTCQSFQEMLAAVGKTVPDIARQIVIPRPVVADLINGWMCEPIPVRLADAMITSLATTSQAFHSAVHVAQENPYLGHAKADKAPVITPRSGEQIIRESDMSEERKRYWLGED